MLRRMYGEKHIMCHREFVICRMINEEVQYLIEESGDDCYTDDLGCAKLYSLYKDISLLNAHLYIKSCDCNMVLDEDIKRERCMCGRYSWDEIDAAVDNLKREREQKGIPFIRS